MTKKTSFLSIHLRDCSSFLFRKFNTYQPQSDWRRRTPVESEKKCTHGVLSTQSPQRHNSISS